MTSLSHCSQKSGQYPDAVAHACSPITLGRLTEEESKFESPLSQLARPYWKILERVGDIASCKDPGFNPQYQNKSIHSKLKNGGAERDADLLVTEFA